MAKCSKQVTVNLEGVLNVEDGQIALEVADFGVVDVIDYVSFMNGENVKVTFKINEDITGK